VRYSLSVFRALRHRNYRLFFSGQIVSFLGTWMHNTAQGWLVYDLTGSSAWLGVIGFLSFVPYSIFAVWGGSIADRYDKRRMILITQTLSLFLAFGYALLVWSDWITIYLIAGLAFTLGIANAFDTPARQAFVIDLVGKEDLSNGIALNSAMFNTARLLGPACAGIVIARLGVAWCLFANALSFIPAVITLGMIRTSVTTTASAAQTPLWHSFREILQYLRAQRTIFGLLLLVGITTIFGWSFVVVLPVFAKDILGGGATLLGNLLSASGFGALAGAIAVASLSGRLTPRRLMFSGLTIFTVALSIFALSRFAWLSMLALMLAGFGLIMFYVNCNSPLQKRVPDALRGRVMGIYVMCFGGLMPIGSLQTGVVGEHFGAPAALLLNAAVCMLATLAAARAVSQKDKKANSTAEKIMTEPRAKIKWQALFIAWTLFGLFMTVQIYAVSTRLQQPVTWARVLFSEMSYAYLWMLLTPLVLHLSKKFSLERPNLLRHAALHFVFGFTFALLHRAALGFIMGFYNFITAATPFSWSQWLTRVITYLDYGVLLYGMILIIDYALQYQRRYQQNLLRTAQLETQLAQAQLQALKMQLHPHFLFNTLNAISVLIGKEPELARQTLRRLSELLRLALENAGTQLVPLKTELDFLQRYLQIERTRFEDRLNVQMNIAEEALPALVPNLILQPLVENAIQHGVMEQRGPARLEISAQRANGSLRLQVRDNGKGLAGNGAHKTGIGLQNTRARLAKLYGERGRFSLAEVESGGVIAAIDIPFEYSHEALPR